MKKIMAKHIPATQYPIPEAKNILKETNAQSNSMFTSTLSSTILEYYVKLELIISR